MPQMKEVTGVESYIIDYRRQTEKGKYGTDLHRIAQLLILLWQLYMSTFSSMNKEPMVTISDISAFTINWLETKVRDHEDTPTIPTSSN